jgi:diguanylate cyclase (GGDEF)-like protein
MRRPSVLIVDDDAFSRAVVSKRIAMLADVVDAEDGFDALAHMQSTVFDLAIVDLEMPNFNGFELIKSVRGHPMLKHIPIIVLTGNETRGALESALTAGATSYLLKPLNWRAFGEHIRHVLELAYRAGHLAMHDALTGLPNRALLSERLHHALTRANANEMVAALVLDLDQFKNVNDTLGHPVGDKLLQNVADRLRPLVGEADTIARMGGDEFAIVQIGLKEAGEAEALAGRIIAALSEPFEIDGHQLIIGTSIGIALGPKDAPSAERLMRNADLALYRAKGNGRGAFCFFKPDMDVQMQARRVMEYDLRQALTAGLFELYYQPLVNLPNNRICGFEALVRWHHPEKGMIMPEAFIPLAEEIGLIVPLGEWIIREACATAAQWPDDLKVAVNVSPAQFREPGLAQVVVSALAASGLSARRLELEITESARLMENDATLALLHQLRELGVRIATDDFGTGYSSLSHLQSFPFDKIKIDRSFVRNIAKSASSLNIVRAVAALARGLGIASTAEGVEDKEQLATITSEGCTEMQGYLLSRPLPARDIPQFLLGRRKPDEMKQGAAAA